MITHGNQIGSLSIGGSMARRRYQSPTPKLRGNRWEIVYREDVCDASGTVRRRQRRVFLGTRDELKTEKLARRAAEPILHKVNSALGRPRLVLKFSEFAIKWQESILPEMKPSTQLSARSVIRAHLMPSLGGKFLHEFTPEMVQNFIATLRTPGAGAGLSAKSVWNVAMTLRSMWNTARAWGYASENLFDHVRVRCAPKTDVRCFSIEDVRKILMLAQEPQRTFFHLAAETGMRAGELCGLRWTDVDLNMGTVSVGQSSWRGRLNAPKTKSSVRRFAVSNDLANALTALALKRKPFTDLIFHCRTGTPWDANMVVKRKLHPILQTLEIERGGMHAFRHFAATQMDRLGAPIATMKARLGHSNLATTDRYTHSVASDDRMIAEKMSKSFVTNCDQRPV
jgi:integrase